VRALAVLVQGRIHYGWIVVSVTFLVMLMTSGGRAAPGVMMVPLEQEFHWSRTAISFALALNHAIYGFIGPFAASAMLEFGLRRTVLTALAVLALSVFGCTFMKSAWHLQLIWGVLVGCSSGAMATTLAATVISRWFVTHRGLAMGLLSASAATGQLVFLPLLAALTERQGWRAAIVLVAAVTLLVLVVVAWLLPERPASLGLRAVGAPVDAPEPASPQGNPIAIAFMALYSGARTKDFWLLFASFFVCGASTNGYIGTHFIAMCSDYAIGAVAGAGFLASMGLFDLAGTTLSGLLSDRFDSRVLLFWYYGLRGAVLMYLPFAFDVGWLGLPLFSLVYGLDWVATVPPTVKLANDRFGSRDAPIILGWIFCGHQLGAASAALGAGLLRNTLGSYTIATLVSGGLCLVTAIVVLRINRHPSANGGRVALSSGGT